MKNDKNPEEGNEGRLDQHIPHEQLISHLRNFFSEDTPNGSNDPINRGNTLRRANSGIQSRINQINEEDEDKDENDNNNNEAIDYQQVNSEDEGSEIRDQNEYPNNTEDNEDVEESLDYESPDELNASLQEEYIDFRAYPLNMDWYEIENSNTSYFDILESYGYFGIATLTSLSNTSGIELLADDFIFSFLNHYYTTISGSNDDKANEFIANLPSLKSIYYIIHQQMVHKKEVICMKVVLDIYEHYIRTFERPGFFSIRKAFFPTIGLFYASLTEEEVTFIYEVLSKQMKNMFSLLIKLGCKVKKQKHQYMRYYNDMRNDTLYLVGGVNQHHFLM